MADILPNGTVVTWESGAGGSRKVKTGPILAFVPAGKSPYDVLSESDRRKMRSSTHRRFDSLHNTVMTDSYIVAVHQGVSFMGKNKGYLYYKPFAKQVKEVQK